MGIEFGGSVGVDGRYSFIAQNLCGSALFARRCAEIERANPTDADEPTRCEHLAMVTAAITQSAAAVEAESAELTMHGPEIHLGSNGLDRNAHDFLLPLTEMIDNQKALTRFRVILHLLGKPEMLEGEHPWQGMVILVRLRNELTHYKSKWGKKMEKEKLFTTLKQMNLPKPPFVSEYAYFFPHKFMGAACAAWAVQTAVDFINGFYERMGIVSRLAPYADRLSVR